MLLYFRGCTAREKLTSISKATERILKAAKINYETLEDEQCCGSVLLRTGFVDDAIVQMNGNLKDFEGKTLCDILRHLPGETVSIFSEDDRLKYKIKSGESEFSIMGISATDFPEIPSFADGKILKLKGEEVSLYG